MAWTAPRTWVTGEVVTAALLNTHLRDNLLHIAPLTGGIAANAFTPTLSQSAGITLSTANGRYMRIGSLLIAFVRLVASSAGTAANAIVLGSLPVATDNTANGGAPAHGSFQRSGGPMHNLEATWATTTTTSFFAGAAATGAFGVNPAVTVASGDIFELTFVYAV